MPKPVSDYILDDLAFWAKREGVFVLVDDRGYAMALRKTGDSYETRSAGVFTPAFAAALVSACWNHKSGDKPLEAESRAR